MRSFMKIKSSQKGFITLSFTDIGKSCLSREFLASLICLLTQLAKIKFSRKFPNYSIVTLLVYMSIKVLFLPALVHFQE